ncbi:fasciclin domain-containing protein [Xanthocytophaga flava]|uniref:fasciclin domain-containing protein n=1 Tax=Xanthocytophaga flava TaxID=3048013 RepID=UPI0028D05AEE|nr:fasciclin domain-containing protein [Xanthocytophaga flavus]MDJ1472326.1 fasciclin domain-containing protein [Xanthocytophaga flavus]
MKPFSILLCILLLAGSLTGCDSKQIATSEVTEVSETQEADQGGQASVKDDESQKDVVKVAIGSPDHSTLVKAVQAADLVNVLSNAGPFTVFAPTNAAFEKLPSGTLEELTKPENKADLQNILQYHVYVGALNADQLTDGQTLNQVNGDNITIQVKEGKIMVNNSATIVASVKASNGMVHIMDGVLLPPKK